MIETVAAKASRLQQTSSSLRRSSYRVLGMPAGDRRRAAIGGAYMSGW